MTNENAIETNLETDDDAPVSDKKREPTEYEKELRRENRRYRDKARAEAEALNAQIESLKAQHLEEIAKVSREAAEKITRAELKSHAMRHGIVDTDVLSLLDISKLKVSESGDVLNADEVIQDFKATKPHFFAVSTSSSAPAPSKRPQEVNANDLSYAEVDAALAKLLGN